MRKHLILSLLMSLFLIGCAASTPSQDERQKRIESSPQYNGKKFQNWQPAPDYSFSDIVSMGWDFFFNKPEFATPVKNLPAEVFDYTVWPKDRPIQFSWLGHTTYLIEMEGIRLLSDPMFSTRASPMSFMGPKRYSNWAAQVDDLPPIDAVLITHDHYDHLDKASIQALIPTTKLFIAPLAVGEYLEDWGVPAGKIVELDWWQAQKVGPLTVTSAPARHFSGRGFFDRNSTLWTSYGIKSQRANLFLSGDSGFHDRLEEIGQKLGPFDVTIFEMGAYGEMGEWKVIHYTPEEAVAAHQAVGGKILVPSHWGTFDLAMFEWHEPIERFVVAADKAGIEYLTPRIGERINPGHEGGKEYWWRPLIESKP